MGARKLRRPQRVVAAKSHHHLRRLPLKNNLIALAVMGLGLLALGEPAQASARTGESCKRCVDAYGCFGEMIKALCEAWECGAASSCSDEDNCGVSQGKVYIKCNGNQE